MQTDRNKYLYYRLRQGEGMVKKILMFLTMVLFTFGMAGCSSSGHAGSASLQTGPAEKLPEQDVLCAIRIIAGDTVSDGILYDNPTAQEFAEKLSITTETWHAAPGFARAFDRFWKENME